MAKDTKPKAAPATSRPAASRKTKSRSTKAKPQPAPKASAPPRMQILAQYIRDLSFENILVQKGSTGEVVPDIQVRVNMDAKKRTTPDHFEVMTKFAITSVNKRSDQTLFALELEYAGLFRIENMPEKQLHPFLLIECPRLLFPYVRRIVGDVTRDGGFPPFNLDIIDFAQLYRQKMARQVQEKTTEETLN